MQHRPSDKEKKARVTNRQNIDWEEKNYIKHMCFSCKFYEETCLKKRIIKQCAIKGLKNKN